MSKSIWLCALLLLSFVKWAHNFNILDFFAPRLRYQSRSKLVSSYSAVSHAENLIQGFGYPCETHGVITEDGYILNIHRIPRGRHSTITNKPKPIALLLHGIFASSTTWLFRGPDKDLPYVFADAGYDMWIGNARGNVYSRKHLRLDPDADAAYWNFSYHEMGVYDLPATIDYILNITNQKSLFVSGHSMGAAMAFILCSHRPEYNTKIRLLTALAPAALITHRLPLITKTLLSLVPPLEKILENRNSYEVFPHRDLTGTMARILCSDASITQPLCIALMFLIVGINYDQFNSTLFPVAYSYYPSGTSVRTCSHIYQTFTGNFGPYIPDNNSIPVFKYNLTKISVPVSLHYGEGDVLITREDTEALANRLTNVVGVFRVPHPSFNHVDFMWAKDAKTLLYDQMLTLMNKYR